MFDNTLDKARKMLAEQPALKATMETGWVRICDKIEARALATRPRPKVFEVRHETELARLTFLTEIVNGKTIDQAEVASLNSVGL